MSAQLLGTITFSGTVPTSVVKMAIADYDGDGIDDLAIWVDAQADIPKFYIRKSGGDGSTEITAYGASGDYPVPADYDNDGKADLAVLTKGTNYVWLYNPSGGGADVTFNWGLVANGDIETQGDWGTADGAGIACVWRPTNGVWYRRGSTYPNYGSNGDIPVKGDWTNVGYFTPSVFRPSNTTWYISGVSTYSWSGYTSGDIPIAADYDGDGKYDMAFWRESNTTLYVRTSSSLYAKTIEVVLSNFTSGDLMCTGDFLGKGRHYIAYYRPSNKTLYFFSLIASTNHRYYKSQLAA